MNNVLQKSALFSIAFATLLPAKSSDTAPGPADVPAPSQSTVTEDPLLEAKQKEQELLAAENKLEAERLTQSTNTIRAEIQKLKLERELLTEKLALEAAKRQSALQQELASIESEKLRLAQECELTRIRSEKLTNDLKAMQTSAALEITRLQNDITRIETSEKRAKFADSKPVFLMNPLKENGTLVISDRRIPLNGLITTHTADYVTSRIQYWNNKDRELPIFIVIDASPGGSVMAGYRILKAMESSDAPVHVVVKSFAASMAAAITTLAEESYAYPNAVILHHQISSMVMGQLNLTEQREFHEESQRWWVRLGTPIANKMGISTEELVKKMYARASSGDWSEFAEQAIELKWVNHIVNGIDETSVTRDPDSIETPRPAQTTALTEEVDSNGKPYAWLPRLNPKDVYFLYNADQYYRIR
jgi:ATP-dependent Clp protease protease subunit